MENETQLSRYKKLVVFLDKTFKAPVEVQQIENICYYSYRNINRIFLALQNETIGQYLKRIKLEKAAEYLKYSDKMIVDIAFKVGYSDIAAFSKAFKKQFRCAPSAYRDMQKIRQEINAETSRHRQSDNSKKLSFEIETLPNFHMLYLSFHGSYENIKAIEKTWEKLLKYISKKKLLNEETIFIAEILDDNQITETLKCRYNAGLILEKEPDFAPEGLFGIKRIESRKYAKFIHQGSHESSFDTYNLIYRHWMSDVQLEFADAPVLEFYLNSEEIVPTAELITEIYIPVSTNR